MMKGGGKMTGVKVNGDVVLYVKSSASPATKRTGDQGTVVFSDKIKKAVDAASLQEEPGSNEICEDGNESKRMADLEKLLNKLLEIMEQSEKVKGDEAEELYAVLQQVYQLTKQVNEDGKTSLLDMLVRNSKAQSLLLSAESNSSQQTPEKSGVILANKIVRELETLIAKKQDTFSKEFLHKLTSVFSLLRGEGKIQAESSLITQQKSKMVDLSQGSGTENNDTTAWNDVDAESEFANTFLEEGVTSKVMHHQAQSSAILGREENTAFTQRNVHIPLIPARFFVNEMEGLILKQAQLNRGTGAMETMLRLFPENLGRVDVRIAALDGVITAQFIANSTAGKEAIEQQLHQLRQALLQQGLQVEKLEVSYASSTEQSNSHLFGQGKGQSQQQNQEKREEQDNVEDTVFDLFSLIEEGVEAE
jgi:flagellar hook-length control protein FliK